MIGAGLLSMRVRGAAPAPFAPPRGGLRRSRSKADLVRAALGQCIAEELEPAIQGAFADGNPLRGLTTVMEAAVSLAALEHNMLAAARHAGAFPAVSAAF